MKHFRFVFAVLLLIGATAVIVSCSSDDEQDISSEAKAYSYTPEQIHKIQTFMDEYDVKLPGLVTSSDQPLPTVDDMLDLVKTIASMQSVVSHPVDMVKNSVTFSNVAKNNLMMSSDVETYSGSTGGDAYEKEATIKYTIVWKDVDLCRGYGEVNVTQMDIDDSVSKWYINYLYLSYSFSGAYTFNYSLHFSASIKSGSKSYSFEIPGSCNMVSGK